MKNYSDEELKKWVDGYNRLPEEGRLLLMSNMYTLLTREQMEEQKQRDLDIKKIGQETRTTIVS